MPRCIITGSGMHAATTLTKRLKQTQVQVVSWCAGIGSQCHTQQLCQLRYMRLKTGTEGVRIVVCTDVLHRVLTSTFLCAIWTISLRGKDWTSTGSSHRTDPQALWVTVKFATRLSSAEPPLRTSMASCANVGEMMNSLPSSFGKSR